MLIFFHFIRELPVGFEQKTPEFCFFLFIIIYCMINEKNLNINLKKQKEGFIIYSEKNNNNNKNVTKITEHNKNIKN